ncbi:unnamed protein product [Brassicogethes aeneus]|uniref:EGF-like domain-containing protein n=1 Tax=Brassicogethes aeneus TaxID=1431903 RepID=A0A9P0FI25_BRAAE|nr:unnamed protein product [Brassicogethes aeneus]
MSFSKNGRCEIFAIFFVFVAVLGVAQGAVRRQVHAPPKNGSRAGICTLEVPTADLLTVEDRQRGGNFKGNGSKPGFSMIEICCSGWAKKPHNHYECEPVCDNCENGNCTAPNVCVCKRGFIMDIHKTCIPTCPIGCLNGVCTTNGVCSCNAGFTLDRSGKLCNPVCREGCGIGGECLGNDICRCNPGFVLDPKTNKCGYLCEGGCGSGTCVGPNRCACAKGFKDIGGTCLPDCPKGCLSGQCTAPNVCSCQPGWKIDQSGSVCQAHCNHPCLNADCTAPDTCTCKKGYITDPRQPQGNKCVAHCPGGCENGTCSAPNFCICNPGFVKETKGSNRCVRRVRRSTNELTKIHYDLIPPQIDELLRL